MKYVVFNNGVMQIPVLIPDAANHCDVSIGGLFTPISAGFFSIDRFGQATVHMEQRSTSTNLRPRKIDEKLINHLLADRGTAYYCNLLNS
jgi:hypothetical protein